MGGVRDWEYQSHPIFENQVKIKQSIESLSAIFFESAWEARRLLAIMCIGKK